MKKSVFSKRFLSVNHSYFINNEVTIFGMKLQRLTDNPYSDWILPMRIEKMVAKQTGLAKN